MSFADGFNLARKEPRGAIGGKDRAAGMKSLNWLPAVGSAYGSAYGKTLVGVPDEEQFDVGGERPEGDQEGHLSVVEVLGFIDGDEGEARDPPWWGSSA